jgi:tetrahydromethanopterin S-methyltransferase subunit A
MTKNIEAYALDDLANDIEKNPVLQSEEFINALPTSALEEMMHYIKNPNIRFVMVQKPIRQMKKHVPGLVKKYQDGDEAALDAITDEWIGPIMDFLPKEKINWFFQIVKEILPTELYQKLYGHTYR